MTDEEAKSFGATMGAMAARMLAACLYHAADKAEETDDRAPVDAVYAGLRKIFKEEDARKALADAQLAAIQ